MTQDKRKDIQTTGTAIGAALAGAALGAGAVLLANKDNRAKVKKTVDMAKENMQKIKKNAEKKVDHALDEGKKVIADHKNT